MLLFVFLLSGCAAEDTFETVSDEILAPVIAQPREISVQLPKDAAMPVLESDSQQIYVCDGYEIVIEKRISGDLEGTVQSLCGYSSKELTLMQTQQQGLDRYEFVWVSTGETGDRLGRAVVLDAGDYHYCMSILRDCTLENAQDWNVIFQSFTLQESDQY